MRIAGGIAAVAMLSACSSREEQGVCTSWSFHAHAHAGGGSEAGRVCLVGYGAGACATTDLRCVSTVRDSPIGVCATACANDAACGAGAVCVGGSCIPTCATDRSCGPETFCTASDGRDVCLPPNC